MSPSAGTIASHFYEHVRSFEPSSKDAVAAPGQDVRLTVRQLDRHVYAYALGMLEAWGLKAGAKVGVWMANEVESVVAQLAVALAGAEVVVLDPAVSVRGALDVVAAEGLRALVLAPRGPDGEERHEALAAALEPELAYTALHAGYAPIASKRFRALKYIACTSGEFVDGIMRFNELPVYGDSECERRRRLRLRDFASDARRPFFPPPPLPLRADGVYDHDDIAAVQTFVSSSQAAFTYYAPGPGGPDAPSRGRSLTHAQALAAGGRARAAMAATRDDVVLSTAGVWTAGGLAAGVTAPTGAGAKLVLPSRAFDAAAALRAAEVHRPTLIVTTPAHAAALDAEAAADAARPAAQRQFEGALARVRGGLVVVPPGAPAAPVRVAGHALAPVEA